MDERTRRGPGRRLALVGGALALGLTSITCTGCRSLSKPQMEKELRALPKNTAIEELRRLAIRADLGEGVEEFELVYAHAGPAEGAAPGRLPVVLVHGTPSTLFSWTEVMHGGTDFDGLAARREVYAIEVVGHGIAPGDAGPYGFERCARFVGAALEALGLERAHLVGSSYGGEFAWRTALNEPDRVAGLVLADSSGYERRPGDWLPEEVEMRENSLAKIGWVLNSRERITTALAPHFDEVPPGRVDEFFLVCENAHNWKAMIDLARDENGDRQDEIADIQAPTLVAWGADDIAYPLEVYGERFWRDVPDAELRVFQDTGHYPHEQRPAEFVAALAEFFERVEARP